MPISSSPNAKDLATRLSLARWSLVETFPILGFLALELPTYIEKDTGNPEETAYTTGHSYHYFERFSEAQSTKQLTFIVAHEVCHVLNSHRERMGGRDPKRWNRACDYAINRDLVKAFALTRGKGEVADWPVDEKGEFLGLYNPAFDDLTSEEIYVRLEKEDSQKPNRLDPQTASNSKSAQAGPGAKPSPTQSPAQLAEKVKVSISRALARAKQKRAQGKGSDPCGWERQAESSFEPEVKWHLELRTLLQRGIHGTPNWARMHRRLPVYQTALPQLYLPSFQQKNYGNIVACVDTSGSVTDEFLVRFLAELRAFLSIAKGAKLHLWSCDAGLHEHGIWDCYRRLPEKFTFKGGGGTSFKPAFEKAVELHKRTPVATYLYLTDTFGDFPEKAPPFPTFFLVPEALKNIATVPFGRTIFLPETTTAQ